MSGDGLRGAWKNTNLYFFSNEIEKMCSVAAKMSGRQWADAGAKPGLQMWRIEEMRPFKWTEVGKLYKGDCYVFLNTFEDPYDSTRLSYDLHFWAGEGSTEDEYGAAMFKVYELDQKLRNELGMVGSMNREVQDFESATFLSYFPDGLTYMSGGIDGVILEKEDEGEEEDEEAGDYDIRLFQVKGRLGKVMLSQVRTARASMNGGDVFVLDAAAAVYVWKGESSNEEEKVKGLVYARSLALETEPEREVIELDQGVDDAEDVAVDFWDNFPSLEDAKMMGISQEYVRSAEEAGDDDAVADVIPTLFRLKQTLGGFATGPFEIVSGAGSKFTKGIIADTKPPISDLKDDGIYLVDSGFTIGCWLGKNCSKDLSKRIFPFAMLYLRRHKRPPVFSINVYRQGYESKEFLDFFGPAEEPGYHQRIWNRITTSKIWTLVVGYVDPLIVDFEDIPQKQPKGEKEGKEGKEEGKSGRSFSLFKKKEMPLLPVDGKADAKVDTVSAKSEPPTREL